MIINKKSRMLLRIIEDKPIGTLINKVDYLKDYYFYYSNKNKEITQLLEELTSIYYEGENLFYFQFVITEGWEENFKKIVLKDKFILKALKDIKKGWVYYIPIYEQNQELLQLSKTLEEGEKLKVKIAEQEVEIARLKKLKEPKKYTKIGLHYFTQNFGDTKKLSLFSNNIIDNYENKTGLQVKDKPKDFGVVLNQSQQRVLEGLLKAFTDTNYKGDIEIDKNDYNNKKHPINAIGIAYKNIDKIPELKITQTEIVRLSKYNRTQSDLTEVVQALRFLGTKQFCFYWTRARTDIKGNILKDKKGDYVKEEVVEVGTILRIKEIRNEKTKELIHYEISPSAPLIDQIGKYFLLVPNNWREEVQTLTGKRGSSYTYEFLLWLRGKFEQIRRGNDKKTQSKIKKPFIITTTWEEVAIALKMPESMYKRNRERSQKIIQGGYSIAIKLGYLIKIENNGAVDTLFLNEKYYPKPGELK